MSSHLLIESSFAPQILLVFPPSFERAKLELTQPEFEAFPPSPYHAFQLEAPSALLGLLSV